MRRHTKPKAVRELGSWKSIWEKYFPIVRVARERKPDLESSATVASTENTAMKSSEKANKRSFFGRKLAYTLLGRHKKDIEQREFSKLDD